MRRCVIGRRNFLYIDQTHYTSENAVGDIMGNVKVATVISKQIRIGQKGFSDVGEEFS